MDRTGQTFGRLTVVERAEPYVSPGGYRKARWLCSCECGGTKIVTGDNLVAGRSRSCGCTRRVHPDVAPGQTYGLLTVIERAEDRVTPGGRRIARWLCQCACGTITTPHGQGLRDGIVRSCGCSRRVHPDLAPGDVYGRLTILERAEGCVIDGPRPARWVCSCECGEITVADDYRIKAGRTRSCGCLLAESNAVRAEVVTYGGMHQRLRRDRGPATDHPCVDCGDLASDWSYDHTDPEALIEERNVHDRFVTVPYSLDPAHYSPRCKTCHVRFDQGR